MPSQLLQIHWKKLLLGEEDWSFLGETIFRSVIMFVVILLTLRLLGKRGIKQLSVFELGVIIGLGSAAGDPMFYKDVGLLAGIAVFIVVIGLYKLVTFFINRSDHFERFVEGKPAYVIEQGRILVENFEREDLARDELLMQLRLHSVSQLGQVQLAILETNGELSIFYYPDEEVRPGLSIFPDAPEHTLNGIAKGIYACAYCGNTIAAETKITTACGCCKKDKWVKATDRRRIT